MIFKLTRAGVSEAAALESKARAIRTLGSLVKAHFDYLLLFILQKGVESSRVIQILVKVFAFNKLNFFI